MSPRNLGKIVKGAGRILVMGTLLWTACSKPMPYVGTLEDIQKGEVKWGFLFPQNYTVTVDIENSFGEHKLFTQYFTNSAEADIIKRRYQEKIGKKVAVYREINGDVDSIR